MKTHPAEKSKTEPSINEWIDVVRRNAEQLRYGSIQITVHDGRVTQVESIERTRFSTTPADR